MSARRCRHTKTDGSQCGGFATSSSLYCFAHDPELVEKRKEARRKGGNAGKIEPNPAAQEMPVRTVEDVLGLMEATINDVRTGRVDVKVANAVGYLANVSLKVIQASELEARMDALESVLAPEKARYVNSRRSA